MRDKKKRPETKKDYKCDKCGYEVHAAIANMSDWICDCGGAYLMI